MKMFPCILLSLFLSSVTSFARLSETTDQCAARYGFSTSQERGFTLYSKDHINIAVLFVGGVSVREVFAAEPGTRLSQTQISELLTANSEGKKWTAQSAKFYYRADLRAYAEFDGLQLTIYVRNPSSHQTVPDKQPSSGF